MTHPVRNLPSAAEIDLIRSAWETYHETFPPDLPEKLVEAMRLAFYAGAGYLLALAAAAPELVPAVRWELQRLTDGIRAKRNSGEARHDL